MLWFSITLRCDHGVVFTEQEQVFKGGMLHGLFETALLRYSPALYSQLSDKTSGVRARYALFPPLDQRRRYEPGDEFRFGVVLFGSAARAWRAVLAALIAENVLKLGAQRQLVTVVRVDSLHPARLPLRIYDLEDAALEGHPDQVEIPARTGAPAKSLRLRFLTPVTVSTPAKRALGLEAVPLTLHQCVKVLRNRLSALEPDIAADFNFRSNAWISVEHQLRDVAIAQADVQPQEWIYGSSTKKRPIRLRGQIGEIEYAGHIPAPVLDLLELGQWLGIGQRTTLGQGWYCLT